MSGPKERPTCFDCRVPIGNRDYMTAKIEKDGVAIEIFQCTNCAKEALKKLSFKEAVEQHVIIKWIGKTWSYEMALYQEETWKHLSEALAEDRLFPKDSLEVETR